MPGRMRAPAHRGPGLPTAGFTLIELMVSLGMLAVISVYLTNMLVQQSRAYEIVDQVTEVQQNGRVISDLLDREIRETGFMVPEASAFCGFDFTNGPDMFFVTDRAALTMRDDAAIEYDDSADIGTASTYDGVATGPGLSMILDDVILDGRAAYDTDGDGTNDSDFQVGGGVIAIDKGNLDRGSACGIVTAVNLGANTLTVNFSPNANASRLQGGPAVLGRDLRAIPANFYWIDTVTDPASPQLRRNATLLAEDVEDLQFSVFLDFDADGMVDLPGNENPGGNGQPIYQAQGTDHTQLREVRVSFVLRGRFPDPEMGTVAVPGGRFQTTENRVFAGANDQFRRRTFTAAIRPRNIGVRAGVGS